MSLEQAVQSLTQTTENLLVEVNTRKLDLVSAVNQANQAAQTSTTQASSAANSATAAANSATTATEKAALLGAASSSQPSTPSWLAFCAPRWPALVVRACSPRRCPQRGKGQSPTSSRRVPLKSRSRNYCRWPSSRRMPSP